MIQAPMGIKSITRRNTLPKQIMFRRERTPDVQKELGVDLRIKKDDKYGP